MFAPRHYPAPSELSITLIGGDQFSSLPQQGSKKRLSPFLSAHEP
jgi:hypothetical protein